MQHSASPQKFYKDTVFELTTRKYLVVAGKPGDGIWDNGMYLLDEKGNKAVLFISIGHHLSFSLLSGMNIEIPIEICK